MDILYFILAVLIIGLLLYGAYLGYLWWIGKQSATKIEATELETIRAGAQIIDVREAPEFDARHILGARNIPMSSFKQRHTEVRRDKAVYLYDDNVDFAPRAARILKKNGHPEVYILKKGFSTWGGKIKTNKK